MRLGKVRESYAHLLERRDALLYRKAGVTPVVKKIKYNIIIIYLRSVKHSVSVQ